MRSEFVRIMKSEFVRNMKSESVRTMKLEFMRTIQTHLEPATAHRVNDGASVGEVLDVPDFEHGAVVGEGLVRAVRAHPKLSGASLHCSPMGIRVDSMAHNYCKQLFFKL